MIRSEYKQLLVLLLGAFCIILYFFGPVVVQPNKYLLSAEGDGLKNYYALAWYLEQDEGLHFSGMNYPFGEHIIYTDNQPALAVILNFVDDHILSISQYTVGIVNFLLFLSLVGCAFFLFLILRKFFISPWYAVCFALLITFLSPQIMRFSGHYSLAYTIFIPMLWYMMIRFMEKRNILLYSLFLILVISLFGFIHLYHLLMGSFFVLAYALVWAIRRATSKKIWGKRFIYLLCIGLLPLILIQVFVMLTDPILDRPTAPHGFFHYRTYFSTIFLPVLGPISEFIEKYTTLTSNRMECQAYVGIVGLLTLIFSGIGFIKKWITVGLRRFPRPVLSKRMNDWLWAGILVVLFSSAIPFRFNLEFLLDFLSPLKQFRSLGRFAWVFYYVFAVYAAYYWYIVIRNFQIQGKRNTATVLLLGLLLIWSVEVYIHMDVLANEKMRANTILIEDEKGLKSKLEKEGYSTEEFQAILTFPFFQMGSEKNFIQRYWKSFKETIKHSYNLRLPMVQGNLSRTSISQTLQLTQLMSSNFIEKEILNAFPNDKPLLLITLGQKFSADESQLIRKGKRILKNEELTVYELPLAAFQHHYENGRRKFENQKDSLPRLGDLYLSRKTEAVVYKPLFGEGTDITFQGKERVHLKKGILDLYKDKLPFESSTKYEATVWIYADHHYADYPIFYYELIDQQGKIVKTEKKTMNDQVEIYDGWILGIIKFDQAPNKNYSYRFYLEGKGITAANFLVRPIDVDVYKEDKEMLMLNNFYLPNKK